MSKDEIRVEIEVSYNIKTLKRFNVLSDIMGYSFDRMINEMIEHSKIQLLKPITWNLDRFGKVYIVDIRDINELENVLAEIGYNTSYDSNDNHLYLNKEDI